MNEAVPRYEFRIFGTCLGMAEQCLRALAPCDSIGESREVYLLGEDASCERNVKIRDGKLELKRLIERHQGLERWKPAGQWPFPVPRETLLETLSLNDTLNGLRALPAMLSCGDLLRLVARHELPLYRANLYKCRFRFSLPACGAEFDQLLVNGAAIQSIAIESTDQQAVLEAQSALRLEGAENQSYPLAIARILGITPLPREEEYE